MPEPDPTSPFPPANTPADPPAIPPANPPRPPGPPAPPSRAPSGGGRAGARGEPVLASPHYAGGAAAVFLPGLGHIVQGRTKRGVLAMVGVLGLFLYGLLIGGIDAVDSREDFIWYLGTAMVGPAAWGTDWVHQNRFKAIDPERGVLRSGNPGEVQDDDARGVRVWRDATPAELEAGAGWTHGKGLGRLNEIAMLSCALAGMLNFIVFLDALIPGYRAKGGGA